MFEWLVESFKTQGASAAFVVTAVWFMLRELKKDQGATREDVGTIKSRMDCFEKSQHICQIDIAKNYATKTEQDGLEVRINGHESRISTLEAKSR